jgi:hypothetical protein
MINKFFYDNQEIPNITGISSDVSYGAGKLIIHLYTYDVGGGVVLYKCKYLNINANMLLAEQESGKLIKAFLSPQLT